MTAGQRRATGAHVPPHIRDHEEVDALGAPVPCLPSSVSTLLRPPLNCPPRVPIGSTLYGRFGGRSIGWLLVRDDGTLANLGAVATLPELARVALLSGAAVVCLKSLLGELPPNVVTFAAEQGWEIDRAA